MHPTIYGRSLVLAHAGAATRRWHVGRVFLASLIAVLGAGGLTPLSAQQRASSILESPQLRAEVYAPLFAPGTGGTPLATPEQRDVPEGRSTLALAMGGVVGGVVGLYGGGLAGGLIADRHCAKSKSHSAGCFGEFWTGVGIGALIGESVLLPLGVHIADRSRGNYWMMSLASLGLGVGGAALAAIPGNDWEGQTLIATAVSQMVASIVIERWTAGR